MTDAVDRLKAALADRYEIERELGAGGMATVYLAHDLKHDRKVAIKVMRPELSAILGGERFFREITIAAKLNHPHILPMLDSGTAEEQPSARPPDRPSADAPSAFLYYVMPYEEGHSLREKLAREGELPIGDAVRILRDVVDALSHAHKQGVVHRDIKPENIMVLNDGTVKVTDFGIARVATSTRTRTGVVKGTPYYMSPEQTKGQPLTGPSDIFSLGVVFYQLLTGRLPFTGDNKAAIMYQTTMVDPEPPTTYNPKIDADIVAIVDQALQKSLEQRYATAKQMGDDLRRVGQKLMRWHQGCQRGDIRATLRMHRDWRCRHC